MNSGVSKNEWLNWVSNQGKEVIFKYAFSGRLKAL